MRRHDWTTIFQAGQAIGNYDARRWIGGVDVPSVSIVTTRDGAVTPDLQRGLASRLGSEIIEVDAGHVVCARPDFSIPVVDACLTVAERCF